MTPRFYLAVILAAALLVGTHCTRSGYWNHSGLSIARVEVSADRVNPGQRDLPVSVRLENRSGAPVVIEELALFFRQGDTPVDSDYEVTPSDDNPLRVEAGRGASLGFLVDVSADARVGLTRVDARAELATDTSEPVSLEGSQSPDSFEVQAVIEESLVVATAHDEDDMQGSPSLSSAGGAEDLSLREALILANLEQYPKVVSFDPAVFDASLPVQIDLAAELGPLPALTRAQMRIDGSGAGVVIHAGALENGPALEINADDVTVQDLLIRNANTGANPHGLLAVDANRLRLTGCTFTGSGAWSQPAQVKLDGGQGIRVTHNLIQEGSGGGLELTNTTSGAVIEHNTLSRHRCQELKIAGSGHQISDNQIVTRQSNDCPAVAAMAVFGMVFARNQVTHLQALRPVLAAKAGSTGVQIESCEFTSLSGPGVQIETGATAIDVSNSTFIDCDPPILLQPGANQDVQAPLLEAFDGIHLRGSSALPAGRLEVFALDMQGSYRPVLQSDFSGSTFDVELDSELAQLAATVTSPEGSTGEFSSSLATTLDLVVSTADDELDGGETIFAIEQAGGSLDLSLREALVIANNHLGSDLIRFDPAVFPEGSQTSILVGPDPLPLLIDDGTRIDGSGAGVTLYASAIQYPVDSALIEVHGQDCAIGGLTLASYNASGGAMIRARGATGLQVSDCHIDCVYATTTGIHGVEDSHGLVLANNRIENCHKGIHTLHCNDGRISGNQIGNTDSNCLHLQISARYMVENCHLCACGATGVWLDTVSTGVQLVGNRIQDCAGPAISSGRASISAEIVHNTLTGCSRGASLSFDATGTSLRNNLVAHNQEFGITSDVPFLEDHNLFFDNGDDAATGLNAVEGMDPAELDPTDVLADPQLADPDSGDLTPGPAAIDAGADLGYDRNGDAPGLFNGSAPDLGAIET